MLAVKGGRGENFEDSIPNLEREALQDAWKVMVLYQPE